MCEREKLQPKRSFFKTQNHASVRTESTKLIVIMVRMIDNISKEQNAILNSNTFKSKLQRSIPNGFFSMASEYQFQKKKKQASHRLLRNSITSDHEVMALQLQTKNKISPNPTRVLHPSSQLPRNSTTAKYKN